MPSSVQRVEREYPIFCASMVDVFKADETGLYCHLLPDKTHTVSGEIRTRGKKSKERITLLVCANMTGTEKLPLLAIVKFKYLGSRNPNSSC